MTKKLKIQLQYKKPKTNKTKKKIQKMWDFIDKILKDWNDGLFYHVLYQICLTYIPSEIFCDISFSSCNTRSSIFELGPNVSLK